ncbi:hypothetical protein GCM10014713_28090 [Streptomyces purpureus]|uniref:Metallophosphoesterase n=1 Tax=Streptomyces purpureus TaxID=1951 RepID=A0A918H3Q4_9ACTN|nr:hypothetical protein GCM10014713_28090 [Streptomyces purpureus]
MTRVPGPRPDPFLHLVEALSTAGVRLDSREIADALWLSRWTAPDAEPAPPGAPDARRKDPAKVPAGHPAAEADQAPPTAATDRDTPPETEPRGSTAPVPAPDPGRRTRAPAASTLPSLPPLQRALRALRSYRPSGPTTDIALDVDATVELAASTDLVVPVVRRVRGRTADLQILMDGAPSMAVWEGLLQELRRTCEQLGAFRDVGVQYVHPLREGIGVTAHSGPGQVLRPAQELSDASGQRVHVVLSDCTGPLWRDGTFQKQLRRWAGSAPLAVLQPLPHRMWQRTALPAAVGLLTRRPGPYRALEFRGLEPGTRARYGATVPHPVVPVLTPTPAALRTWARLVSSDAGLELRCAAAPLEAPRDSVAAAPGEDREAAAERLAEFAETASPAARQLAVQLSAAPLSVPVMQLVQRAMLPQSGPGELAEVLLGGLVRELDEPRGGDRDDGRRHGPWFEFQPYVRELLLEQLSAGEAALVLKHCAFYIERTFGRGARNFPAIVVAHLEGTGRRVASGSGSVPEPFVYVSEQVMRRFEREVGYRSTTPSAAEGPVAAATAHLRSYAAKRSTDDLLEALRLLRTPAAADHPDRGRLYTEALLHAWTEWRDPDSLRRAEQVARARTDGATARVRARDRLTLARVLRARGEAVTGDQGAGDLDEAAAQLERALGERGLDTDTMRECALLHTRIVERRSQLSPTAAAEPLRRSSRLLGRLTQTWPGGPPPPELRFALGRVLLQRAALEEPGSDRTRELAERAASALDSGVQDTRSAEDGAVPPARALFDLAEAYALSGEPFTHPAEGETLNRAADAARREGETELEALALGRLAVYRWARHRAAGHAHDVDSVTQDTELAEAEMKRALSLLRPGDPQRVELLVAYGRMLLEILQEPEPRSTVSEAVHSLREAVADTAPSHPSAAERRLLLARALRERYHRESMIADLYEACWTAEEALRGTEIPAPRAQALLELGGLHRLLAERTEERGEWGISDDTYRRAATEAAAAGDPLTAARALHGRGEVLEYLAGPARALEMYRQAREQWDGVPGADPAEVRRTDDRIRHLGGTR